MKSRSAIRCVLLGTVVAVAGFGPTSVGEAQERTRDSEIVERAEISLVLLDVEVVDRRGQPMPGLKKKDFAVRVNGFTQPIYSVDDLCRSQASERVATGTRKAPEVRSSPPPPASARVVVYFDFSQLQQMARLRALETVMQWLEKKPDDALVQVIGYASLGGVKRYSPFTSDRQSLATAVAQAADDPAMIDPFPSLRDERIDACRRCIESVGPRACRLTCKASADAEYQHGRRSLSALLWYIRRLERFPEHKRLLYFHQNGVLYPARFYFSSDFEVGDHNVLMDEIGAEATLSQTTLYPAYSADSVDFGARIAVNVGANLADFTGGDYNRAYADLMPMLEASQASGECVYRLGIVRPPRVRKGVARVVVSVRGRDLPFRYRTLFLDEADRWMRRSQGVLAAPEMADDVRVQAALLPLLPSSTGKNAWRVAVQVAVWPDSLTLLPKGGKYSGNWEVGALVYRQDGNKKWELFSVSEITTANRAPGAPVVHEHVLPKIGPGTYRVAAFARDTAANLFGGAEATVAIHKSAAALVGPLARGAVQPYLLAGLRILGERNGPGRGAPRVGHVPMSGTQSIRQGETFAFRTLLCAKGKASAQPKTLRFVSQGASPLFRFEEPDVTKNERCTEVLDTIETVALAPGEYEYHLRWRRPKTNDQGEEIATFSVVSARVRGATAATSR